jgi:hypothetical protein
MIRHIFRRPVTYIKHNFNLTAIASTLALIISLITMYFQFFNIKHELLYTFLFPSVDEQLTIPIVYKNAGNQNEMILESNIELEVIPNDGSDHYYQRIGDENKKLFPLIIAPGDYKMITLLGDYKDYFKGILEQSPAGLKYRKIVNLDTLSIVITTKFISGNEVTDESRHFGRITFKKDRTFDRIDYKPIRLTKLEAVDDVKMTGGSLINNKRSMSINSSDLMTTDQIEEFKFMINMVEDTAMKTEMIKFLKKRNIKYP